MLLVQQQQVDEQGNQIISDLNLRNMMFDIIIGGNVIIHFHLFLNGEQMKIKFAICHNMCPYLLLQSNLDMFYFL